MSRNNEAIRNVLENITTRRTIRRFRSDPISDTVVQSLLKAAIHAPNAGNAQPWYFVVVKAQEVRSKLADAALGQAFVATAPVVIVVCADLGRAVTAYGERGVSLYCIQDTAAATQNILLAAHALGFGGAWVGAFDERKVSNVLSLPEFRRPVAIVAVGKPAEAPSMPQRMPVEEVSDTVS